MTSIREEIIEVPSNESGKRMFVKRIIKYYTRVNQITGENEVVEGETIDEPIENFDQPICTVREEIVERPSKEEGKKRFVKKIVRTYIKINPITGEMEVVKNPFIKAKEQTTVVNDEMKTREQTAVVDSEKKAREQISVSVVPSEVTKKVLKKFLDTELTQLQVKEK